MNQSVAIRPWQFWLLAGTLLAAFLWFLAQGAVKCRCYLSAYHEAQSMLGLALVGLILARVVAAALFRDKCFSWRAYFVLCLTSPLWIALVFGLVLWIRDWWVR